jgi:hypothetical protein
MNTTSFKFVVKECFKLSTGATAFVGLMEPHNFPIITDEKYTVEIRSNLGKCYRFNKISEDIFARSNPQAENRFRSLQTFENVEEFTANINTDHIVIVGARK